MTPAQRWTLTAAVLGSSVTYLDSSIVTVALPAIGRELPVGLFGTLEAQTYVYTAYLLSLNALLILAGALTDFYGRRRVFAIGLAAFGLTSVLCGLAPRMEWLILGRLLQGGTAALLVPGALSLIRAAFDGPEQGRAYGVWSGAAAGATILAPFVGGVLVDAVSWRMAFLINVPVVATALWVVRRHVAESRDSAASGHFHWSGAALVALAVGGLAFGPIYGGQRGWRDPLAFVALGAGLAGAAVFPWVMARARYPLVPLSLFRSRNFAVTNLATLVIYGALYVTFYYLTLYLQGTLGYTAAAAGLALIPGSVFLALFSARFGALAGRYGPRWFMAAGPAVMVLGVLWLARLPPESTGWALRPGEPATYLPPPSYLRDVLPGVVAFGLGLMVMVAPLTTALMTSVPSHRAGLASAINNTVSGVGPLLAGALVFVFITAGFYRGLAGALPGVDVESPAVRGQISPLNRPPPGAPPEVADAVRRASTDAFQLAMTTSAVLLAVGAVIDAVGIRNPAAPSPAAPPAPTPAAPPLPHPRVAHRAACPLPLARQRRPLEAPSGAATP